MCALNKFQIVDKIKVNLIDKSHLKVRNSCQGWPLLLFKPDIKHLATPLCTSTTLHGITSHNTILSCFELRTWLLSVELHLSTCWSSFG